MKFRVKSMSRLPKRAVACATLAIANALSFGGVASANSWPRIEIALESITTVTGQSVLVRMRACGIRPDKRRSRIHRTDDGYIVWIPVAVPNGPGEEHPLVSVGWTVKNGKAVPDSVWSEKLQYKQGRLGASPLLRC